MDKKVKITGIRLDLLKYFKECKEDDTDQFFLGQYTSDKISEEMQLMMQLGYFENCESQKFKLSKKGLDLLNSAEQKVAEQKGQVVKIENSRYWDRFIDNGYKIIGIPILIWTAILQYNQVDNNADIKKLQEKLKEDSIQFSTTLTDLRNQLTRQNIQLQSNRETIERLDSVIYSSSLKSSLKVDKSTTRGLFQFLASTFSPSIYVL
ncbi:MAG: hypothetical protein ACK5VF_02030 [Bacteroidota bacterium]|jgi:hypothetical protein